MPKSNEITKESYLEIVDGLVRDMKYGTITIIVQDGKVIQIDKTDKIRLKS
ncbi:MAG: YezD family protein [Lachnospiraceae bacterium]|nr:YezD family protein [Lachnospiraceae bacterium]